MEKTARAIIIKEDEVGKYIVSIKRTKYDDNNEIKVIYYTFPGGHVENDETYEETLKREVDEELGINININYLFIEMYNEDLKRTEAFYICEHIDGKIGTGTGPEWSNVDYKKYGKYEIENIYLNKLDNYNLLPKEVVKKLKEFEK